MKGIYIAAIITTIVSIAIWTPLIFWKVKKELFPVLLAALLLELPMCALAFYLVRMPLDGLLEGALGESSTLLGFLRSFWAPLTEEPAKLLPLLLPWILRKVDSESYLRVGLALGLGFGLGEIWVVGGFVAGNAATANIPWFLFTGFLFERLFVCLMHGAFTATALRWLGKGFPIGVLFAMALHFFGNFPIYLASIDFGGLGAAAWQATVGTWIQFYIAGMGGLLVYYKVSGRKKVGDKPSFAVWQILSAITMLSPGAPFAIPALLRSLRAQKDWEKGDKERARGRMRHVPALFTAGVVTCALLVTAGLGIGMRLWSPPSSSSSSSGEDVENITLEGEEREAVLAYADPLVDNLLEGFNEGDYEKFSRDFTDEMKAALPWLTFLTNNWTIKSIYGAYQSRTPTEVFRRGDQDRIVYHGVFERAEHVEVKVGFKEVDGQRRVSALWFSEPSD